MKTTIAIAALVLLSGCATISGGPASSANELVQTLEAAECPIEEMTVTDVRTEFTCWRE